MVVSTFFSSCIQLGACFFFLHVACFRVSQLALLNYKHGQVAYSHVVTTIDGPDAANEDLDPPGLYSYIERLFLSRPTSVLSTRLVSMLSLLDVSIPRIFHISPSSVILRKGQPVRSESGSPVLQREQFAPQRIHCQEASSKWPGCIFHQQHRR